jgi:ABC-2 type transport system permease protein
VSAAADTTDLRLTEPIKGPSALGSDRTRFFRLTWTLAVTAFKLRFYGSALGYLWQLMRPLMLFGVLYVVFSEFVRVGAGIHFYPAVLLTGIVLFTFLSQAGSEGVTSVVERESLIRKVEFPRMAIPCATVLTALFNLGLNLIVVVIFAVIAGVDLHASIVQVPLVLAVFVAMVLGIVLLTSALYVSYRDVAPIWDVVQQIAFYATPVLYPIEVVRGASETAAEWLLTLNPFAVVVQQIRHAAIDPTAPSPVEIAGVARVSVSIALAFAVLVVGFVVFRRRAPHIAEEL